KRSSATSGTFMTLLTNCAKVIVAYPMSATPLRNWLRKVNVRERAWIKPARCDASCTESVKTSAFFSARSRSESPKSVEIATDVRVETAEPTKRMASSVKHAGQTSSCDCSTTSSPSKAK